MSHTKATESVLTSVWRHRLADAGPLIALIVLIAVFAVVSPIFLSQGNVSILLTQLSIPIVVATGMTFVILLGSIDLSVSGVMATSSLVFVLLAQNDRNDISLGLGALLIATLVGGAFGVLNGLLNVRLGIPSFMATLGTGAIGIGVATVLFGGRAPRLLDESFRALGTGSWGPIPLLFLMSIAVIAIAWAVQRYTKVGRYGYVIGGDEPIAKLSGIAVGPYKIAAFVLAGLASGLAGALSAMQLGVGSPQIGADALFAAITAVVLGGTLLVGGRGGVLRSLVGVGILVVLANGLILVGFDSSVQIAVQGAVIIVAVAATGWRLRRRIRVIK
ncbi:ABC transporter permease [Microbacterium sp. CFH 90308]|uniref:ABC transporter permease n=1 Tax=Microbacterium salsuginis TaxID=2722803 RepID=A0ABX1KEP1_9MICO|nr:ABC transporter permease [Microbacterium sp. CFH 90308]NLP84768.1 ABC transporter permease [Microbacterium sp. CFH 90308]